MKTLITTSIFLLLFTCTIHAQTFKEYKKSEQQKLAAFKQNQTTEINKLARHYNDYVQQADKDFAKYLDQEWKAFNAFKALRLPKQSKPITAPVFIPQKKQHTLQPVKIIPQTRPEITPMAPRNGNALIVVQPVLPLIQKTENPESGKQFFEVKFYGSKLSFPYDKNLHRSLSTTINQHTISKWWSQSSKTNYNPLINKLLETKSLLSLNDWAYFLLVNKSADVISTGDHNTSALLTWFLMVRSGYNIKVAYQNNHLFLLFPSVNHVYGKNFISINNEYYYFLHKTSNPSFHTYTFDFPGAARKINFNIYHPLNIGNDLIKKQVSFTYKKKNFTIPVVLDMNNLQLMKDYPTTDLSVFFNARMSQATKESVADGLMPIIAPMDEKDALNFLLSFVQKAFKYETDQEQFGREKYFFPEEVFYYPASDCEDRAGLYSYLVEQLLHLKVIGLVYKGHVATAVHLDSTVNGDYLDYKNIKYTIADPTYINAPLGLAMPKYENMRPRIIETDAANYLLSQTDSFWHLARQSGAYRGSNLTDAAIDDQGNCYLTGYFVDTARFGTQNWHAASNKREAFVAKYNKSKKLLWAHRLITNGVSTAFAITLDKNNDPTIAGSFQGKIIGKEKTISTKIAGNDVFVAHYNTGGTLLWLQKSDLDTVNQNEFLNYVIRFGENGQHLGTKLYLENSLQPSRGIFFKNNIFTIMGGINNTTGLSEPKFTLNASENFNVITYLKDENDALIADHTNNSIAGLFAVFNLIKNNGMSLAGKDAQKALDNYNPSFKQKSPDIYENIGKINFVKNDDGIISLQTHTKHVSFSNIRVDNNAKIKIISLKNGNDKVDVISGIRVGKMFVWFDLNSIELNRYSGNLLFDYDSDHTLKTVNMKKDVLY